MFQLVTGCEPDVSHIRIFGCAVYVPIAPPQRTKMGPQRKKGIYVGYETSSILRYLEPLIGDLFTARFADCHFDETVFPPLGGETNVNVRNEHRELTWNVPTLSHLDPRTVHSEIEVRRIIQNVAHSMPDAFSDLAKVTRSHIPAANVPARIDVPVERRTTMAASQSVVPAQKRGRPSGSKDSNPRKRTNLAQTNPMDITISTDPSHEIVQDYGYVLETNTLGDASMSAPIPENREISTNFACLSENWNRNEIIVDDVFVFAVATEIISSDDIEPRSVDDCQRRVDWPKWKEAIQVELDSLAKRRVFGPVVPTPPHVKPVGFKWVFVRKRNEKNEIVRYKARLVAQGFSQRPGIDYEETYSPVMDVITFRYLISLVVSEKLNIQLMDVVTAYLYGDLDTEIYMKVPD